MSAANRIDQPTATPRDAVRCAHHILRPLVALLTAERQRRADGSHPFGSQLCKLSSTQLKRDGALISRYPLLIQKTMADELSAKISNIIAPPPGDGGFIGNTLLGANGSGPGHVR